MFYAINIEIFLTIHTTLQIIIRFINSCFDLVLNMIMYEYIKLIFKTNFKW